MDITNKLPLRLRAAGWTAAVAAIPAYASAWYIAGPSGIGEWWGWVSLSQAPTLTGMALVAAGISGYFLCWRLFDSERYHHGWRAAGIGVAACLLAYLLLSCMVVVATIPEAAGNLAKEPLITAVGLVVSVPFLVGMGLLITGWFTVPLAAIAAYLFSLMYRGGG